MNKHFLCRIGLHAWAVLVQNLGSNMTIERCLRAGCHRQRMDLCGEYYYYDKVLCSCGAEIVHLRDNFWRRADTGEVCNAGHWHEPAK